MKQEMEYEHKTIISNDTFQHLLQLNIFSKKPMKQINYYFETDDFQLKKNHCALRIRKKEDNYTLTLKQVVTDGVLESHETISNEEFIQWIDGNPSNESSILQTLQNLHINSSLLKYYGYLTTFRYLAKQNDVEYVLDESHYNGLVDYELEVEAHSPEKAEDAFTQFIKEHEIQKQKPVTKVARFFQSLPEYNQDQEME